MKLDREMSAKCRQNCSEGVLGVKFIARRGDRVAYGDGLENRFRCMANVGSNPTPSAIS